MDIGARWIEQRHGKILKKIEEFGKLLLYACMFLFSGVHLFVTEPIQTLGELPNLFWNELSM